MDRWVRCRAKGWSFAKCGAKDGADATTVSRAIKQRAQAEKEKRGENAADAGGPPAVDDLPGGLRLPDLGTLAPPEDLGNPLTAVERAAWYDKFASAYQGLADQYRLADQHELALQAARVALLAGEAARKLTKNDESDDLRIPRSEVNAKAEAVRAKITQAVSSGRPLLCAHCNRALSVKWGRGEAE